VTALLAATAIVASALTAATPTPPPSPHPINAQGFVTDGSPQRDDGHCIGTADQRVACLVARRPECQGWDHAMDPQTAMACWAPEVNVFDWPHDPMFDALYCESKGETGATNGRYRGLLQDDGGDGDPVHDLEHAYYVKWEGQRASAWAATYGRRC
jgi:hypothetical protein